MVLIYCKAHHGSQKGALCPSCHELLDYALVRLERCRYAHKKPTCGNCPAHCYKPSMKEKVMEVMAYSGPRMSYRHPVYALYHFFDSFRPVPQRGPVDKESAGNKTS